MIRFRFEQILKSALMQEKGKFTIEGQFNCPIVDKQIIRRFHILNVRMMNRAVV